MTLGSVNEAFNLKCETQPQYQIKSALSKHIITVYISNGIEIVLVNTAWAGFVGSPKCMRGNDVSLGFWDVLG